MKRDPERDAALKAEIDAIRDAERAAVRDSGRRLLGSAAIYPDGTAKVTQDLHLADVNASEAPKTSIPQVSPFVAGRHDLQPRPFKRRWWSKGR